MTASDAPTADSGERSQRTRPYRSAWVYGALFLFASASAATASWWLNDDRKQLSAPSNLAASDLSGAQLVAVDLQAADFTGSMLDSVDFTAANLRGADFTRTKATNLVLVRACLRDTQWAGARATEVILDDADIRGADFRLVQEFATVSAAGAVYDARTRFTSGRPFPGSVNAETLSSLTEVCHPR